MKFFKNEYNDELNNQESLKRFQNLQVLKLQKLVKLYLVKINLEF